ncbi:BTAD domain-containing putative transcriptional regulator [Streptomyces pharetrae]|uniref:BTAD domain-containing putative transcriptional regulator n=1 Tax=Streptomyces pharetrae TaxID=291370 RepID=UPI00364BA1EB
MRGALGDDGPRLSRTGAGYRLSGADIADLRERRAPVGAARAARDAGRLERAVELARQAEELWRGEFTEALQAPAVAMS